MLVESDVSCTVSYKGLILPILFTRSEIVTTLFIFNWFSSATVYGLTKECLGGNLLDPLSIPCFDQQTDFEDTTRFLAKQEFDF